MKTPLLYKQAAELARLAGQDLLSQLQWMTLQPAVILDVGCGTGEQSAALQAYYPKASVLAIDIAMPMLTYAKNSLPDLPINWLRGDAQCLPLANHSVDLIFANFFLAWQADLTNIYREWLRVLRPHGLLICNLFGPGSLQEHFDELKELWIPGIIDMHDAGNMLLAQGFADPVLVAEQYTLNYKSSSQLSKEMYDSDLLLAMPDDFQGKSITIEIVSAHAFAPAITKQAEQVNGSDTTTIPLSALREQLANLGRS